MHYRDLGRARTQVACRLHTVLCDLVPGGFGREITAGQAADLLQRISPSGPAAQARCELAADFLADLRRLDAQRRNTRTKLAAAVAASGTTLTEIFGVGPVIAAAIIGATGEESRFDDRDRFAAYNGTAPIEVSSGERKIHRLSLRGNRRLNHTIHMAAVTRPRTRRRSRHQRRLTSQLQAKPNPGSAALRREAAARPAEVPFSGQPLPDQPPAYDQESRPGEQSQRRRSRTRAERLDNKEVFVLHADRSVTA